jgi:hypothetical protein
MAEAPIRTIGIPWYDRADYSVVRSIMVDPHILAPTYDLWLAAALNNESVAQQAGLRVVRVPIQPDEFTQWCAEQGLALDGGARAKYAMSMAQGESD